jgi:hypothetical protein
MNLQTSILGLTEAALKVTRPALFLLFMYTIDNAPRPNSTNLVKVLLYHISVEERVKIRNSNIHVTYQELGINSDKGSCSETLTSERSTVYHRHTLFPLIKGIYGLFRSVVAVYTAQLSNNTSK